MSKMTGLYVCAALIGAAAAPAAADAPEDRGFYATRPLAEPPQDLPEIIVFLESGTDAAQFAREHGVSLKHALRSDPNAYVMAVRSSQAARAASRGMVAGDRRVRAAYVNQRMRYVRMAFVPDDVYFHKDTPVVGWPGQWHLLNEHTPGLDVRVQGAWNRDVTGNGVTIGVIDDCLQTAHADLAPNYVGGDSWDFGQDDNNPDPVYSDDYHGICVAGVAAARGGNGLGVTGAAPLAGLAGLRIDFYNQTTQVFVDATLYHSSGTNTNIKVKNHSYGLSYPYVSVPAEVSALATSTAAGTIHVFAAGNERGYSSQDSNTKDLQHSPDAICVAALGSNGKYASYSCFGACVFVTAPSSSSSGLLRITTTDCVGEPCGYNGSADAFPDPDYTSRFGGTSSAAPLVAGVMALVRQVQPALNVRFAKHLLARTSDVVDPTDTTYTSDGGWKTNAAGYRFNQNYGFGLIDADELTQLAGQYVGVTALTTESTGTVNVNAAIPDNDSVGVTRNFEMVSTAPLEEVLVTLSITHGSQGQLEARLTSPSGTTGRLFARNSRETAANINWTFTSNTFWGENPAGTWTLNVIDTATGYTGTWNSFAVTARMGALQSAQAPEITRQPAAQKVAVGGTATFTVEASGAQPLTYRWQKNQSDLSDGGNISGATTATLQITNCAASDIGSYRCVVTNSVGSATSSSGILTVSLTYIVESRTGGQNYNKYFEYGELSDSTAKSTAAGLTAGIGSRWGNMGTTWGIKEAFYNYTAPASGLYEVFATWPYSENASASVEHRVSHVGGTTSVFMNQLTGANQWNSLGEYNLVGGVTYTVTQTNRYHPDPGKVFRADAVKWELISAGGGPTITQQPSPQDVCPGATATFTIVAGGQGTLTYQWQKDGGNLSDGGRISGATTGALQIAAVEAGDVGQYRCVLTDSNGTSRSQPAALTVNVTTVTRHPTDVLVPPTGGVAIFAVEASGKGTLTYQWQKDTVNLSDGSRITGATTSTLRISECTAADQGGYRCVVTADCGAAASNPATLTVTSGPITYIVETRTGGQNRENYSEFGTFADSTAKSTAANTTAGIGSRWGSMDRAASGIKRAIYSYTAPATGVYEVFATWPASENASEHVEHIVSHAGGSTSVILDQDKVSNPAGANQWTSLGQYTLTGGVTYTVIQTNENYPDVGEIFRADAVKWEYRGTGQPPAITQHPADLRVCPGATALFTVAATGDGVLSYRWQKNMIDLTDGGHYSGVTTTTLVVSNTDASDVALYRCVVTNAGGSTESDEAALTLTTSAGDFDGDCDVDLSDFSVLQSCFNGPNRPPATTGCGNPDFDSDMDVDLSDFGTFQACFNGPNRPPACPG